MTIEMNIYGEIIGVVASDPLYGILEGEEWELYGEYTGYEKISLYFYN